MHLVKGPHIIQPQGDGERVLVRVRASSLGQIFYSFWAPDFSSAVNELQNLRQNGFFVELVQDGKIL
jgi:hypothetical protein